MNSPDLTSEPISYSQRQTPGCLSLTENSTPLWTIGKTALGKNGSGAIGALEPFS
jgi:hypothetical protein